MIDDIEHEMQRVARIVAADSHLLVEVRGDQAYSQPGRIVLPALERFDKLGMHNARRLLHGICDHEAGHAADTDFAVVEQIAQRGEAFKALWNALEDGYVERRRIREFPGSEYNLASLHEWFWETEFPGMPATKDRLADPARGLWTKFIIGLAVNVAPAGGRTVEEIGAQCPEVADMLRAIAPITEQLEQLAAKPNATAEVFQLAKDAWSLLMPEPPPKGSPPPPERKPRPGPPGEGLEIEVRRYNETPHGEPLNAQQAMQRQIRRAFEPPDELPPYVVFDPTFDLERDFSAEYTDALTKLYETLQAQAEAATASLAETFEAALRAKRAKRLSFDADEEDDLDDAMLGEFAVGAAQADDLWIAHQADEDGDHAAVAVLVDCSGSMNNGPGSKSWLARVCAVAVHEALKRVGVAHEITGFTTITDGWLHAHPWAENRRAEYRAHFDRLREVCIEAHDRGTDLAKFARTCAGDPHVEDLQLPIYGVFKGFESAESRGIGLIAGIMNNLDGEAVLWQARRLARRPERRKVLIVLSDGYPAGSHDNAQGARYLSDAVKRALGAGIEVYGIGIHSSAVQEFYPHWWVCRNLSELPSLLFRALFETVVEVGMDEWTGLL